MEISKIIETNRLYIAALLVAIGVAARLVPHEPNFAPVAALVLVTGVLLGRRYALGVALSIMMMSDMILGLYSSVAFTWAAIASIALLGGYIKKHGLLGRVVVGGIGASVLFFIVSNFGVWISSGMYAHSIAGLVDCYVMALPFFRATLASDLVFTASFFSLLAAAEYSYRSYYTQKSVV